MVILSVKDSDKYNNLLAPGLFKEFPNLKVLANSIIESLIFYISKIRNFGNNAKLILQIAKTLKADKNIPLTMSGNRIFMVLLKDRQKNNCQNEFSTN